MIASFPDPDPICSDSIVHTTTVGPVQSQTRRASLSSHVVSFVRSSLAQPPLLPVFILLTKKVMPYAFLNLQAKHPTVV